MRKIQVRTYNETDLDFDTSVFLQHFGSYFRSPCIQLGENLSQPEYVLTATLKKDRSGEMLGLGITLGFTKGKIGARNKRQDYVSGTYDYYFGNLVDIRGVGTLSGSLDVVIEDMKKDMIPSIDQLIRSYEQIPVSAEISHNLECESTGRFYKIHLDNCESRYPRIDTYREFIRIVGHSERGKITNGVALEDDEKYKVLSIQNPDNVSFFYEPPEGEDKSDTIIIYNSCDILHEDVLPLSKTKKNIEIARVELRCVWEGTIASQGKISSQGDESLITAITPKSKYQSVTNWKLDVEFKLDRGNDRVKVYKLESARFDFLDELEFEQVMRSEAGELLMTGKDQAEAKGRKLTPSECDLEIFIDLKRKTYKIEGILHVQNITVTGDGRFKIDWGPPIQHDETEKGEGTTEYKEEILIGGKFKEDFPEKLAGRVDEMEELPEDFVEFMEGLAGNVSSKIRWKLEWQGDKNK
jgi:hypothetical protein